MEFKFTIDRKIMSHQELLEEFETNLDNSDVEIHEKKSRFRNVDPTVVVALVGVAGAGLVAIINALALIATKSSADKIVLQSESGSRLEVPSDLNPDNLDQWIEKLKKMDSQNIQIVIPD